MRSSPRPATLIADGVDAVFTPTDNKIMEAELAIAPELAEAGIPHYTGADSFVRNGAFATCGVNYTDLGTRDRRPGLSGGVGGHGRHGGLLSGGGRHHHRQHRDRRRLWARTTPCSATWARWWKSPPPRTKHALTAQYRQSLRQDAGGALA